jgi:hypothetical protein
MTSVAHSSKPKRNIVVAIRLDEDEHAAWTEAAHAVGRQQLGRWAREHIARSLNHAATPESAAAISDVRRELIRIGNNLNQLTRKVNAGNISEPPQNKTWQVLIETRNEIAEVRDKLNELDR